MGKVAVLVKIFPTDMEHYDAIKENLRKNLSVGRIDDEAVAFGFNCMKVVFIFEDKEGSGDLEERLKKVDGVSEVQIEDVGLI